jgi:hypothetical protein
MIIKTKYELGRRWMYMVDNNKKPKNTKKNPNFSKSTFFSSIPLNSIQFLLLLYYTILSTYITYVLELVDSLF